MAAGDAGADLAAPFHQVQTDVVRSTKGEELITVVRRAYDSIKHRRLEITGEATAARVRPDGTSPARARARGGLQNIESPVPAVGTLEFYSGFGPASSGCKLKRPGR
jgi:hypothetical protein